MYQNTEACIKMGRKITQSIKTNKGLKQGCSLSPLLFNIYMEQVLETWYKKCSQMGVLINDRCLHSLLFADDQVILASDREDMEFMLRKLKEEYEKWGLKINLKKTEYLCIGGDTSNIKIDDDEITNCSKFKYLGTIITDDGKVDEDITTRLAMGRNAIKALHSLIWNNVLRQDTKRRIFHSVVENIILYGAEMWPLTKRRRDRIRSVELDFMRRSLQITKLDKIRNEVVWERAGVQTTITRRLENKALQWYGHVQRMQNERWPIQILNWIPERRRRRGRPVLTWKAYIQEVMNEKGLEEGQWNDRKIWKSKTANS